MRAGAIRGNPGASRMTPTPWLPECRVCGKTKAPWGRSVPMEARREERRKLWDRLDDEHEQLMDRSLHDGWACCKCKCPHAVFMRWLAPILNDDAAAAIRARGEKGAELPLDRQKGTSQ